MSEKKLPCKEGVPLDEYFYCPKTGSFLTTIYDCIELCGKTMILKNGVYVDEK